MPIYILDGNFFNKHVPVDPLSKALSVTHYDTESKEIDYSRTFYTYRACVGTPAALQGTLTDIIGITGCMFRKIWVVSAWMSTISAGTAPLVVPWSLVMRETPNEGGARTYITPVTSDPTDDTSGSNVVFYTTPPTLLGALIGGGPVWGGYVPGNVVTGNNVSNLVQRVDFVNLYGKPLYLEGSNQGLYWNLGGLAVTGGGNTLSPLGGFTWIEQDAIVE